MAAILMCIAIAWPAAASVPRGEVETSPAAGAQVHSIGTYLIVYADQLKDAADAWAEYRKAGGWTVVLRAVGPTNDQAAQRLELQQWIRQQHAERAAHDNPPAHEFDVLILGDAIAPGKDRPEKGAAENGASVRGVPAWRFAQIESSILDKTDPEYATDDPYQLLDEGDELADIALGRVPAATSAEALIVLDKIKRYEADREPGRWRERICYAAGEGRFGASDAMLEELFKQMVDQFVPVEFDVSMMYAKATSVYCPPPSKLTATVLSQLSEGSLLFNYVGHGQATALDRLHWGDKRIPILRNADVAKLGGGANPGANPGTGADLPIALLTCCSAGWFDLPGGRCLAEELLFHPAGPIAVIAGSRPTHPYCNGILQKDVTNLLLVDRVATIGALDLAATRSMIEIDPVDRQIDALTAPIAAIGKWPTSLRDLRRMHARLYNLLGDPATRIARPGGAVSDLAIEGNDLAGRADGIVTGRVNVTIQTERGSMAKAADVLPVIDGNDPDLEAKAAHNFALANDRILRQIEGPIIDGRFRIALGGDVPSSAAVVKVYAAGTSADGRTIDGFGGLRLPRRAAGQSENAEADR